MRFKTLHTYWDSLTEEIIPAGKTIEIEDSERIAFLRLRGIIDQPIKTKTKKKTKEESLDN